MILVRNRLKKLKKTIEDEDMLNYLRYSHLDMSKKPRINNKEDDMRIAPENNETHAMELAIIETPKIDTANKGVDTGNDFEKIVPPYVSLMYSEDFDRNEKMVQVWTRMFPPLSSSGAGDGSSSPPSSISNSSSESFISKNIRRGFRLAEFAYNASVVGFNMASSTIGTAVDVANLLFDNQNQHNDEAISVQSSPPQTINSSPRQTINSSSSDVEEVPIEISSSSSSRQTQTTIPQPTSPQSTPASSAKTTPRKKSK